ncbi:MAG: AAA family ATPase [Dehalococcoidia bacterium]
MASELGAEKQAALSVIDNLEKVIIGKRSVAELAVTAIISGGHILIEDLPGVGKTMLARSLAVSLGLTFNRVQFVPDLLPSDLIGVNLFNQQTSEFEFRPGPIMSNMVLADEINRGTPKTQSALLEAMEESQITIDGVSHLLPKPFFVIATQNPLEHEGTFLLPEAQRDRFFLRINLGYPSAETELEIVELTRLEHPIDSLNSVISAELILDLQESVRNIYIDDLVKKYAVDIVQATRKHPAIFLGASPRGSLNLVRGAQARALIEGRDYVLPDDVKNLLEPIISHRIVLTSNSRMQGTLVNEVIREIVEDIPIPGAAPRSWLKD